jgi:plastocyanin
MQMISRAWLSGLVAVACLHMASARAEPLRASVVDQTGAPVVDAVVYATPVDISNKEAKPSVHKRPTAIIDQIKRRFVPLVSVVQTGTAVSFPNRDNIEHDVYSFSPAKRFELHLYHGIPAKPVVFDQPGLVVMGCNIHDQMIAYLLVVDTPWFAKTDAHGQASIENVAGGAYRLTVWHYRMAEAEPLPSQDVSAGTGGSAVFKLQLKSE